MFSMVKPYFCPTFFELFLYSYFAPLPYNHTHCYCRLKRSPFIMNPSTCITNHLLFNTDFYRFCDSLQEMIDEADRDGDGEINEQEFLKIMKKTSLY